MRTYRFISIACFLLLFSCAKEEKPETRGKVHTTRLAPDQPTPTQTPEDKQEVEEAETAPQEEEPEEAKADLCSDLSKNKPAANGTWAKETANPQETVQGSCKTDYVGDLSITCSEKGWGEITGVCAFNGCVDLSTSKPLTNAAWQSNLAGIDTSVNATCNSGYQGTPSVQCKEDRTWGNISGGCTPEGASQCVDLTKTRQVPNGAWPKNMESSDWGGTINGTCNEGYNGDPFVTCIDGTWSEIHGTCAHDCTDLAAKKPPPAHGVWLDDSTNSGATVPGQCLTEEGYQGSFFISCEDGTWGDSIVGGCTPVGQQACVNPPPITNGYWGKQTAEWGESLQGQCNPGFWRETNPTVSCKDGVWEPSEIVVPCVAGCTFSSLPVKAGLTWPSSDTGTPAVEAGRSLTGTCDATQDYQGTPTVSCLFNQGWGTVAGACIQGDKKCDDPPESGIAGFLSWSATQAGWGEEITGNCINEFYRWEGLKASCNSNLWTISGSCMPKYDLAEGVYTIKQSSTMRNLQAYTDGDALHFFHAFTRTPVDSDNSQRWYLKWVPNEENTYYLKQVSTNRYLDAHINSRDNLVVTRDGTTVNRKFKLIPVAGTNPAAFEIQQVASGYYLDAYENYNHLWQVYLTTDSSGSHVEWTLHNYNQLNGTYSLKQVSSKKWLDAWTDSSHDYRAVLSGSSQTDGTQSWFDSTSGGGGDDVRKTIAQYAGNLLIDFNRRGLVAYLSGSMKVVTRTSQSGSNENGQYWQTETIVASPWKGKIKNLANNRYLTAWDTDFFAAVMRNRQSNTSQHWIVQKVP
ncbi:MAG: RICIN domain-containing protein [Deltaproteobacteria bacterium]|nr:RICIN domain-containing protein [Deltaproteobacteria bacterium]